MPSYDQSSLCSNHHHTSFLGVLNAWRLENEQWCNNWRLILSAGDKSAPTRGTNTQIQGKSPISGLLLVPQGWSSHTSTHSNNRTRPKSQPRDQNSYPAKVSRSPELLLGPNPRAKRNRRLSTVYTTTQHRQKGNPPLERWKKNVPGTRVELVIFRLWD